MIIILTQSIEEFAAQFTEERIEYIKIKNNFYLLNRELNKIRRKINETPSSFSIPLGRIEKNKFIPSTSLLKWISLHSNKKIFLNKKGAWLFVCKRDVFGGSILKAGAESGLVLVQNENDENLGYGQIVADLSEKHKVVVKNLFDIGDFLRRERNR